MLQTYMMIGVGGSGGKTLRYAWRELDRRLRAAGWTEGIPDAWQFLHLDVPQEPDGFDGDVPRALQDPGHYLGLARFPNRYSHYDGRLAQQDALLPALAGWRPDPGPIGAQPVWNGAGQRRVIGRTIALSELDDVYTRIRDAVSVMTDTKAIAQLQRLEGYIGKGDQRAETGRAIVVTSLGGGSGSGAFLDVSELLISMRTVAEWLANPISILYAPDVFTAVAGTGQVAANSLAAVSEMLAAYAHEDDVDPDEAMLLAQGGGSHRLSGRRGPRYNLMIGRENDRGIGYTSPNQVFQAVGRALVSFVANPKVSADFDSYLTGNWNGPAMQLGLSEGTEENPCSSFGYANVSLGNSLFDRYASERLARSATERLVWGHLEGKDEDDRRTEEAVIEDRAKDLSHGYFDQCGLHELGKDRNQVLDSLRDLQAVESALTATENEIKQGLLGDRRELTPKEWYGVFGGALTANGRSFANAMREERVRRAGAWTTDIQQRVADHTVELVGRAGLPVAIEAMELLDRQLEEASRELEIEARELENGIGTVTDRIRGLFGSLKSKVIGATHSSVTEAMASGRSVLLYESEAELRTLAVDLVEDLRVNLLKPLRTRLVATLANLRSTLEDEDGSARLHQWPSGPVPRHLRPTPNEMYLNPVDGFPDRFDDGLVRTFDLTPGDSLDEAVGEVVSGLWVRTTATDDGLHQSLLQHHQQWYPRNGDIRDVSKAPRAASFTSELDLDRIQHRAEDWIEHRRGAMGGARKETLKDYLDPNHKDAAARGKAFVDAFERALRASRPLVKVNASALSMVHRRDELEVSIAIDGIPVSDPGLKKELDAVLGKAGVPQNRLDGYYDATSSRDELEITTFYSGSLSPLVFSSVTDPILSDWATVQFTPDEREKFWHLRRARPLASFIPLSPTLQERLARGWLVAVLTGNVDPRQFDPNRFDLRIWTPDGERPFPRALLGRMPAEWREVFPALMESLPLVLMGTTASEQEIAAYARLATLGEKQSTGDELVDWVQRGARPDTAEEPAPELSGSPADDAAKRALLMQQALDDLKQAIDAYLDPRATRVSSEFSLHTPRLWELRHVMAAAIRSVSERVEDALKGAAPQVPRL